MEGEGGWKMREGAYSVNVADLMQINNGLHCILENCQ